MKMPRRCSYLGCGLLAFAFFPSIPALAADTPAGDAAHGKIVFTQSCVLCHSVTVGPQGQLTSGQGPSLAGIFNRPAASLKNFNYSQALSSSGIVWSEANLDRFLTNPGAMVPGTMMPIMLPDATSRHDVIAYLATVAGPNGQGPATGVATGDNGDSADWSHDAPGKMHRIDLAKLPAPFSTGSAGNGPKVVSRPEGSVPSVPEGFQIKLFASGFTNPRILRRAPNGDIFLAETRAGKIVVLRAEPGADQPSRQEVFASGLSGPFGIAFYPLGEKPEWVYVANNNSVIRFPYHNGDLVATGPAQTIVPELAETTGGHSTRDIAFSLDGKRLFVSVGSGSNVAESIGPRSAQQIAEWESTHGRGAAWDSETNRADILVTTPDGRAPLRSYANGVRNGVGIAVNPGNGELWTATNERDGLGDDLVPDYLTHLQEGAFYGWPWYYYGTHEDPRHTGERPDLRNVALVPDVPVQAHSAALELAFYDVTSGAAAFPSEYRGDIFVCFHGSWNRASRTGYKLVRVRFKDGKPTGEYQDFAVGFVVDSGHVWGRPVGIAVAQDGSLLMSEDGNGTIWRISPVKNGNK